MKILNCFETRPEAIKIALLSHELINSKQEVVIYTTVQHRQITSNLADFHFASTKRAIENLQKELILSDSIFITGNTVINPLLIGLAKIENGYECDDLFRVKSLLNNIGHRRENFGLGFENLCLALKEIALKNKDVIIIYPVHLNPNVQEPINRIFKNIEYIFLINPLDYPSFLYLMKESYLIITDSGDIQEEASFLGIPVLVTRNITERLEAVESNSVKLVGINKENIEKESDLLLTNDSIYNKMQKAKNTFGDEFLKNNIQYY